MSTSSDTAVDVYQAIADALAEECGVPREKITPDANLAEDLGLDSLAFIDLCYALDMRFDIKIPFEEWVNSINSGNLDPKEAFRMKYMVAEVENLVRSKAA
ncbi:MAG TPA: phosphopantetheine-binding protein [Microvirga sp.]|jgi:acyl carrier protein|nr:phosphopantetheine-binding protein [Microvirga sp.]